MEAQTEADSRAWLSEELQASGMKDANLQKGGEGTAISTFGEQQGSNSESTGREPLLQVEGGTWEKGDVAIFGNPSVPCRASVQEPVGVGMAIEIKQGHPTVVDLIPGSPAWNSGQVAAGDAVVFVDGVDVRYETVQNIVRLVKGDDGTRVVVALQKAGVKEETWVTLARRGTAGIGVAFEKRSSSFVITAMNPSGSAAQSGKLQLGDKVVGIDSISMQGKTARDFTSHVCGRPDTKVDLAVQRGHALISLSLERTPIIAKEHKNGSTKSMSADSDFSDSTSSSDSSGEEPFRAHARGIPRGVARGRGDGSSHPEPRGSRGRGRQSQSHGSTEMGGIYGGLNVQAMSGKESFNQLQQRMAQADSDSDAERVLSRRVHSAEAITKQRKFLRPPSTDPKPASPAILSNWQPLQNDSSATGSTTPSPYLSHFAPAQPGSYPRQPSPRRASSPVLRRNGGGPHSPIAAILAR